MPSYTKTLLAAALAVSQLIAPFAAHSASGYEYRAMKKGLVVTSTPSALPAADLSASTLTFPATVVGEPATAQSVLVLNAGNVSLGLGGFSVSKPFTASRDCPATLAPGAQCAISVGLTPVSSGSTQGTLTVETDAGTLTATLQGTGLEPLAAELSSSLTSVSAPSGAFADTAVNSLRQATYFVRNTGQAGALSISATLSSSAQFQFVSAQKVRATNDGASFSGASCGASLAAGALSGCTADAADGAYPDLAVTVRFLPTSEGLKQSTLSVTHNGTNASPLSLALTGTGVGTPTADVSATTLVWSSSTRPTDVGSSSTASVRLTNNGTSALALTGPVQLAGSAMFSASSNCPASLPIAGFCDATVTFSPTSTVVQTATLTFPTSAGSVSVALNGEGLQATGTLAPNSSASFGELALLSSASRTFTFTNTGNKSATGLYVQSGSGSAALVFSSNTCGTLASKASVVPGATCSFTVTWTPASGSALADSVQVVGTFASSPASVSVTGTVAEAVWESATYNGWEMASPFVRATYNNTVALCSQSINGSSGWRLPTQGEFESLRTSMNIAGFGWPSSSNDYYWTSTPFNPGTHVVRLAVSGGSYATDTDLHYPVCVRTFASGELTANAGSSFGSLPVSSSDERVFTFTAGPVALSSVSPQVTGSADLSISATTCTASLAANASCTVTVRYAPSGIAALSNASVSVSSSAENSPASVGLTGQGVADTTVQSLLHFDGANGSTVVTDSITGQNWANTGISLSTAYKKFGTASGSFGTTNYAVSTQNIALGSNNFTAELWFYPTRIVSYEYLLGQLSPNNNSTWWLGIYNGKLTVGAWNGVSWTVQSPNNVTLNQWNHAALVRSGSQLRLYMNGSLVHTNSSGVPTFATNKLAVGIAGPTWTDGAFSGQIDEVRISNGAVRYTGATYTMPTAPF